MFEFAPGALFKVTNPCWYAATKNSIILLLGRDINTKDKRDYWQVGVMCNYGGGIILGSVLDDENILDRYQLLEEEISKMGIYIGNIYTYINNYYVD